ncbi:Glycogenin-2 [Halotydeus destructor]|nr:Glycogenin-2 [Halotydeus destructor]
MDERFKIPNIPTIHVASYQSESSSSSSKKPVASKPLTSRASQPSRRAGTVQEPQIAAKPASSQQLATTVTTPSLSQLCPSCSAILVSYFQPLQQYINIMLNAAVQQSEVKQGQVYPDPSPITAFSSIPQQLQTLLNSAQETALHGHASSSVQSSGVSFAQSSASSSSYSSAGSYSQPEGRARTSPRKGILVNRHEGQIPLQSERKGESGRESRGEYSDDKNLATQQSQAESTKSEYNESANTSGGPSHQPQGDSQQYDNNQGGQGSYEQQAGDNDFKRPRSASQIAASTGPWLEGVKSNARPQQLESVMRAESGTGRDDNQSPAGSRATSGSHEFGGGERQPEMVAGKVSEASEIERVMQNTIDQWQGNSPFQGSSDQGGPGDTVPFSMEEEENDDHPFAIVTMAHSNLTAVNAILLANSLILTSHRSVMMDGKRVNIPLAIILSPSVDPILRKVISMVFDDILPQSKDIRLSLLSDKTFGVQQNRLQLWRALAHYDKCLYIDASSLVVGEISDLFLDCGEFSACVDTMYPDNFSTSMFVFEPNEDTYSSLVNFATQEASPDNLQAHDEDGVDEMTILNKFFAAKWNKLSFVYNYSQNAGYYTQQPAFLKFGGSVKIVNFNQGPATSTTGQIYHPADQPWHVSFDLLTSSQSSDVSCTASINNYVRFYLTLFMKRLWPIMQQPLTPQLVSRVGRRDWSVYELVRLLSSQSGLESDDHIAAPIAYRRMRPSSQVNVSESDESDDNKDEEKAEVKQMAATIVVTKDTEADDNAAETIAIDQPIEDTVDEAAGTSQRVDDGNSGRRAWESGKADWMGAHQSDKLIERLKGLMK